jgi:uncharacterized alpha-E superfamily protein
MWENINATWLEMRGIAAEGLGRYGISRFCEWVKERSHLFRGATFGTIMRGEAYRFIRLGTFIERADNTLRLLDARYEMLGEAADEVSDTSARGYYEWSALLRALSSFEAFTEIYRGSPRTHKIAELLLLRPEVPRSLRACMEELNLMLAGLPGENGRPAQRLAAELDARLRYTSVGEVLDEGLHTWLTDFILLVRQLGSAIHTSYLEVV